MHDKTNKLTVPPAKKDQPGHQPSLISLRCVHEESLDLLATHWEHSEDSDQTERMPRLICLRWAHRTFCHDAAHSCIYKLSEPKRVSWLHTEMDQKQQMIPTVLKHRSSNRDCNGVWTDFLTQQNYVRKFIHVYIPSMSSSMNKPLARTSLENTSLTSSLVTLPSRFLVIHNKLTGVSFHSEVKGTHWL